MAATPVRVMYGFAGITGATLKLFALGSSGTGDPANGISGDTLTALTNRTAVYEATVTEALSGRYEAYMYSSSGVVLYTGVVDLADTTDVCTVGELAYSDISLTEQDIEDIVDGVVEGVGGLGGSYTVTVTVTDDNDDPIQGATVKIKFGTTIIDSQSTNASGVAAPTADAGTYTLVVSAPGLYASSSTALVVDGDETVAVQLSSIAITVDPDPDQVTGYIKCLDDDNEPVESKTITFKMIRGAGDDGFAVSGNEVTMTSDVNGIAQHSFIRGATYEFRYGNSTNRSILKAPLGTASTWLIGEIIGKP